MKKFIAGLIAIALISISAPQAHAAVSSAVGVRVVYSAANVGISSWTPIVTSTVRAIKGITIFNSSISPIEVGMATAGSSAGTETRQILVPGKAQTFGPNSIVYYPLVTSQSMRISIRALDSAATSGELDASFFYN